MAFPDYGRIINLRHFKRLMGLMQGSTIALGGASHESQLYIGMWPHHHMEPCDNENTGGTRVY